MMPGMRNVLAAIVLAVTGAGLATWYLARRIEHGVFRVSPGGNDPLDLHMIDVGTESITVRAANRRAAAAASQPGIYGLQYDCGYGQVSDILSQDRKRGTVTRRFAVVQGDAPQEGDGARIDSFAYPLDPLVAQGLQWENVDVDCDGRANPAWMLPGDPSRWAILVHGKGASRGETLRVLPLLRDDGWTCLATTYRNDPECEQTGKYGFGAVEWEEVEAAVDFAVEHGATEVLLVGYSMGGGIALSSLGRSPLSHLVRGVILDAPMTNLREIVRLRSKAMRVPPPLAGRAMNRAIARSGVGWTELDYHAAWAYDALPVLLFHGDDDDVIPVALSDTFAANRANITYHRVPGAGHVRSWNTDRARYESAVRDFLAGLRRAGFVPSGLPREGGEGIRG
jgi:pimeloyl-ACP methyl ester carboxylesterase